MLPWALAELSPLEPVAQGLQARGSEFSFRMLRVLCALLALHHADAATFISTEKVSPVQKALGSFAKDLMAKINEHSRQRSALEYAFEAL